MSDTEETTEVDEAPPADETPPERHLRLKQHAVEVLHQYGNDRDHCGAFDAILEEVGLPGRSSYYADPHNHAEEAELLGEETEEEFEAWRITASQRLFNRAEYYGLSRGSVDRILRAAGLPVYSDLVQTVEVRVEGTFNVPLTVEVPVGEDLIDHVTAGVVRVAVRDHFGTDAVTWKVVVDTGTPETDGDPR